MAVKAQPLPAVVILHLGACCIFMIQYLEESPKDGAIVFKVTFLIYWYFADSSHTTGVGTFVYAAPEQLNGSHYDSKVNTLIIWQLNYDYLRLSYNMTYFHHILLSWIFIFISTLTFWKTLISSLLSQSDMYSIGVLALELFQPFGTEMERVRTLGDLREGKIPDSFYHKWPVLTKYIIKLTSQEPGVRPTASQLLQSELFWNKDIVCSILCY